METKMMETDREFNDFLSRTAKRVRTEASRERIRRVAFACVGMIDQKNYFSIYVQTRQGTWFRHFEVDYIRKYHALKCLRKVLINDFYYDHEMWCRSTRPIPGIAVEVN